MPEVPMKDFYFIIFMIRKIKTQNENVKHRD